MGGCIDGCIVVGRQEKRQAWNGKEGNLEWKSGMERNGNLATDVLGVFLFRTFPVFTPSAGLLACLLACLCSFFSGSDACVRACVHACGLFSLSSSVLSWVPGERQAAHPFGVF